MKTRCCIFTTESQVGDKAGEIRFRFTPSSISHHPGWPRAVPGTGQWGESWPAAVKCLFVAPVYCWCRVISRLQSYLSARWGAAFADILKMWQLLVSCQCLLLPLSAPVYIEFIVEIRTSIFPLLLNILRRDNNTAFQVMINNENEKANHRPIILGPGWLLTFGRQSIPVACWKT